MTDGACLLPNAELVALLLLPAETAARLVSRDRAMRLSLRDWLIRDAARTRYPAMRPTPAAQRLARDLAVAGMCPGADDLRRILALNREENLSARQLQNVLTGPIGWRG